MNPLGHSGSVSQLNQANHTQSPEVLTGKTANKNGRKVKIVQAFKWLSSLKAKRKNTKTFAASSWQVGKAKAEPKTSFKFAPQIQRKTEQKPAASVDLKSRQETYFKGFKSQLAHLKTTPAIERFVQEVKKEQTLGHLTKPRAEELLSLANLKKGDIALQNKKPDSAFDLMLAKAPNLHNLKEAASFKKDLTMQAVKNEISEPERMRLQGKLTRQLRTLATDKQQAKGMTIELLKQLTGSYSVARDVQEIVTKTLGFTPHKVTGELEERAYNLRKR